MKSIIPLCLLALSVAQDTQDEEDKRLPYTCYVNEVNATIDRYRETESNTTSHHFVFNENGTMYEADGYIINEDSDGEYLKVFGLVYSWDKGQIPSHFKDYYRQYFEDKKGYTPDLQLRCPIILSAPIGVLQSLVLGK
ncbi:uncharacterized protein LOC114351947 [Ostrinia furnacalis]|uniref:uncharacterized protein LOC114351947 n=1 Tax=Ostrinia furnacalis TaxID=93504 RepID=UPI00103BD6B2|nr:uncharacterized protein LOC114351947 [Ostrinia furnacalis]